MGRRLRDFGGVARACGEPVQRPIYDRDPAWRDWYAFDRPRVELFDYGRATFIVTSRKRCTMKSAGRRTTTGCWEQLLRGGRRVEYRGNVTDLDGR